MAQRGNRKRIHQAVGAVALAGLAGVSWAGVAGAIDTTPGQTPSSGTSSGPLPSGATFSKAQQRLETALTNRQNVLDQLTSSVQSTKTLSSSVQQTLESQLSLESAGIGGLLTTVQGETSATQLRQSAQNMVDRYRVYEVMTPKVRLAEGAADEEAVESALTAEEPTIEAAINKAQANGVDVQAAQTADEDLVTQVANASSATQGVDMQAVLSVDPSSFPADGGPLSTARSALESARSDLKTAASDLATIRTTLKGGASTSSGSVRGSARLGKLSKSGA